MYRLPHTDFRDLQTCGKTLIQIPDYIQIVGIILGMCTLGYLGDKIGRKWGSVFTASVMLIGAILLTATDAPSDKGFVIFYIISQVTALLAAPCLHHCSACLLSGALMLFVTLLFVLAPSKLAAIALQ